METRIILAVPNYDGLIRRRAANVIHEQSSIHPMMRCIAGSSLLTQTFNALWCSALNMRDQGITHFAMLHSDIEPEGFWIDDLIAEMDKTDADIISAVVPLKIPNGLTSTAIDTDKWRPRRLTMNEVATLPETFCAEDVPWADGNRLLVNTGCMVCRFTDRWVERVRFHIEDRIIHENGKFVPQVVPEDWGFSRWAHGENLIVRATTKVRLIHVGITGFPNYGTYGQDMDAENMRIAPTGQ